MKPSNFLVACLLCLLVQRSSVSQEPNTIGLWPGKSPGETGDIGPEREVPPRRPEVNPIIRLTDVSKPTLAIYRAENPVDEGTCVIVAPGGGYNILAFNHEGTEICEWLNSIGITAALLKYRVPRRDKETPHIIPLKDAQRAIRIVRSKASELGVSSDRVGFLGFSAGGHLAVMTGTHFQEKTYEPIDDADTQSARPDFMIPIYPAYLLEKQAETPRLSSLVSVTEQTPPTFMAITYDDADRAIGAALLLVALKQNSVPCELHVYHKGGHGYGMRPSEHPVSQWPQRCQEWMLAIGMLSKRGK